MRPSAGGPNPAAASRPSDPVGPEPGDGRHRPGPGGGPEPPGPHPGREGQALQVPGVGVRLHPAAGLALEPLGVQVQDGRRRRAANVTGPDSGW